MGAIYGHGGHLDLRTMTICTYFESSFNTRLHMKFEENWPRDYRGEVVQRCGWMDGRRRTRLTGELKMEEKMLNTESRMFILSCAYAHMMSLVTPWLFSAFKGEYPVFLSDINF